MLCHSAGCSIEVKSYGYKTEQLGYIRLNGVAVWQAAYKGTYPNVRGVSVMTINPLTCLPQELRRFDTGATRTAAPELIDYLQEVNDGSVIVGVTGDNPRTYLTNALYMLQVFGIDVADVQTRGSFAFIAQKGFLAKTVLRKVLTAADSRSNPAAFNASITGIQSSSAYNNHYVYHII